MITVQIKHVETGSERAWACVPPQLATTAYHCGAHNMPVQCHYSVLGVERDADDDDIKKAYRKLALQVPCLEGALPMHC